ncbi:MAG TPA: non-heme iron oxygenase ferredoxin subunit [Rhodocyclaceae bacterium]
MQWIEIASVDAFPPGTCRTLEVDGLPVAVFNVEGNYFAISDTCTHETQTLSDGFIEDHEVVCPRHGSRFSLITGAALSPPAYEPIATFPVRIEDGMVKLGTVAKAG